MKLIPTIGFGKNNKTCGDCTKCCEGWIRGNIQGKPMYPGQPCSFVKEGSGCSVYSERPYFPCKEFNCSWLTIKDIPDEWKPSNCGVIMVKSVLHGYEYVRLIPAPNNPSKEMIDWAKNFFKKKEINLLYSDDIGIHPIGDKWFIREVREHKDQFKKEEFDEYVIKKYNLKP